MYITSKYMKYGRDVYDEHEGLHTYKMLTKVLKNCPPIEEPKYRTQVITIYK